MSNKRKIWGGILLVCLILTLWQIPNFKIIWREYKTFNLGGQGKGGREYPISLINPEAAKVDPEAHDILNYLISKPDINELSTLVLQYPDNEFFTLELSNQLLKTDATNPQAVLNLAGKLVTLKPENAHYRYLKACALLSLHTENIFEQAIDEIEIGNKTPIFEYAYSGYTERVNKILKKTKTGILTTELLEPDEDLFYNDLRSPLSHSIQSAITSSDQLSLIKLTDIALVVGDKLIENGLLGRGVFFILSASIPKLKYAKISQEEVNKVRFQHARAIEIMDILGNNNRLLYYEMGTIRRIAAVSAIALSFVIYLGLFWCLIFVIALIRKRIKDVKVSIKEYLQYGSCFVCYLIFISFVHHETESPFIIRFDLVPDKPDNIYLFLLILPLVLWIAFRVMSLLPTYDRQKLYRFWLIKAIVCAAIWLVLLSMAIVLTLQQGEDYGEWDWMGVVYWSLVCMILWAISVYGWFLIRSLPYKWLAKNRGIQLILISAFLAGLNQLLINNKWLLLLPTLLLISCSAIIIVHCHTGKIPPLFDALYHFFSKRDEIAATRTKILRLISPYVVVFWLIFLVSTGSIVPHLRNLNTISSDPFANVGQLPLANKSTYESIVKKIDFSNTDYASFRRTLGQSQVKRYLSVLGSEDLSAILVKLKKAEHPISDYTLLSIMVTRGADGRDLIIDLLEDPESEQALISRAKSGDTTVKSKLERLFDDNFSKLNLKSEDKPEGRANRRYDPRRRILGRCFDIASSLAAVSEPNETMRKFMDIFEKIDSGEFKDEQLSPAYYFYKSINSLPRPQAIEFLKTYLEKTGYLDLSSKRRLSSLKDTLAHFADTDIAEQIFIRTSYTPLIEQPLSLSIDFNSIPYDDLRKKLIKPRDMAIKLRKAISPYFSKSSIAILKNELNSDNPNLRAYVVWQLTKLGYEWSEQELEQLSTDEDWKIRLNTLFAMDEKAVRTALDDENPVVRVTAKLIVDNK